MSDRSCPDLVNHARVAIAAGADHALAFAHVVIAPGVRAVRVMVLIVVLAGKLLCKRNIMCGPYVGADLIQLWMQVCTIAQR